MQRSLCAGYYDVCYKDICLDKQFMFSLICRSCMYMCMISIGSSHQIKSVSLLDYSYQACILASYTVCLQSCYFYIERRYILEACHLKLMQMLGGVYSFHHE